MAAVVTFIDASVDACTAPTARSEVWFDEVKSVAAVDFMLVALSPTVRRTSSIRSRNLTIAASTFARRSSVRAHRRPLLLDAVLLGHVVVGRDPTAAGHHALGNRNRAAVRQLDNLEVVLALRNPLQDVGDILRNIALEISPGGAMLKNLAQ